MAGAYQRLGRHPEAEACYREAMALAPDDLPARFNFAILLLLLGRLEEGWPGRELRWEATGVAPRAFQEPAWDGSPLAGRTILVHGAQEGLGDAIMALRYTKLLKEQGARVLVACAPTLAELFRTCPWQDQVILEGESLPPCHCQAPLMSLPWLFRTRLDTIPSPGPYLSAPPSPLTPRQRLCAQRMETCAPFRIGLVFAGKPDHPEDARRSLPPQALEALALLRPRAAFFSLQQHRDPPLPPLPKALGAVDLGDLLEDFTDTARAVAALDLVISVDTAVAHLAGAMGKPVQLLLPHQAEWRWMLDRADSPWYPSFRLYRQDRPGAWAPVLQRLAQEALP
jgi:tetratricopeptide (TPR) repeat protein